jgi:mannose-6-phosphate isomerase-like protein (cupin superfamily)
MNREKRPWGWFETIEERESYKLKKIHVNPNQQFSLQYHDHREEHWIVVEGSGFITLDKISFPVNVGDKFKIEVKQIHRMKAGAEGILFYEVQMGDKCDESDIKRLEDDYGRTL